MKVAVIGTGHVGLVTAATLALFGNEDSAVDSGGEKLTCCVAASHRCSSPVFPSSDGSRRFRSTLVWTG
jgi:UDP-glucose 6-dehydrogenase